MIALVAFAVRSDPSSAGSCKVRWVPSAPECSSGPSVPLLELSWAALGAHAQAFPAQARAKSDFGAILGASRLPQDLKIDVFAAEG